MTRTFSPTRDPNFRNQVALRLDWKPFASSNWEETRNSGPWHVPFFVNRAFEAPPSEPSGRHRAQKPPRPWFNNSVQ